MQTVEAGVLVGRHDIGLAITIYIRDRHGSALPPRRRLVPYHWFESSIPFAQDYAHHTICGATALAAFHYEVGLAITVYIRDRQHGGKRGIIEPPYRICYGCPEGAVSVAQQHCRR